MKDTAQRTIASTAFVIMGRFPASSNVSYQLYTTMYELPTGGIGVSAITPDAGSVNPYTEGTPIDAPNRSFTILVTADSVAPNTLPASLRNIANRVTWPSASTAFTLVARGYGTKAGYTTGGTGGPLKIDWPDHRTYDVTTGAPVDCAPVQPNRDRTQQLTPWNERSWTGVEGAPAASHRNLDAGIKSGNENYAPKPNKRLVEFFRVPALGTGLPGSSVPPPAPDACANYLEARLNQTEIALVRVPKVPTYQPSDPGRNAVYSQTDTQFYTFSTAGRLRSFFNPGKPDTYAIGAEDIKEDRNGGATMVVWPRSLTARQRARVFAYARARGWTLLQGNANSPGLYANALWMRANGPASTWIGGTYPTASRSGAPCMDGPQSALESHPATASLRMVAPGTAWSSLGSEWAAVPSMMGPYTPQGVQCSPLSYLRGDCLKRLKEHIRSTGGRYTVPR